MTIRHIQQTPPFTKTLPPLKTGTQTGILSLSLDAGQNEAKGQHTTFFLLPLPPTHPHPQNDTAEKYTARKETNTRNDAAVLPAAT